MIRAAGILALLWLATAGASARLGESEAESIARYGVATAAYDPGSAYFYRTLTFNHAGYAIVEEFIESTCEMICFQKPDGAALGEDDLDLLLQSEADGKTWTRSRLVSVDPIWDRSDGAQARYDATHHAFAVCSAVYLRAEAARHRQDKARQLDSL